VFRVLWGNRTSIHGKKEKERLICLKELSHILWILASPNPPGQASGLGIQGRTGVAALSLNPLGQQSRNPDRVSGFLQGCRLKSISSSGSLSLFS
jgi:hypothetical protein